MISYVLAEVHFQAQMSYQKTMGRIEVLRGKKV